jgi:hypothetical protein
MSNVLRGRILSCHGGRIYCLIWQTILKLVGNTLQGRSNKFHINKIYNKRYVHDPLPHFLSITYVGTYIRQILFLVFDVLDDLLVLDLVPPGDDRMHQLHPRSTP